MTTSQSLDALIARQTFVLSTSGTGDPLVTDLRRFLLENGAKQVIVLRHPFQENARLALHFRETHLDDGSVKIKQFIRPHRPPLSFPLDLTIPIGTRDPIRCWFGFTNLSAAHAFIRLAKAPIHVCAWYIDYVPDRFGRRSLSTTAYERLDKWLDSRIDLRIELTEATAKLRSERIGSCIAKIAIGPIGQWIDEKSNLSVERWRGQDLVYLGGITERLGAHLLVPILLELTQLGWKGKAQIIGSGDSSEMVSDALEFHGLASRAIMHGYIKDRAKVEELLRQSTVAVAPYAPLPGIFTETTDSAKLKAYAGASLPIITTPVTLNCRELELCGAAKIVDFDAALFAKSVMQIFGDYDLWLSMAMASHRYAQGFDWNEIFLHIFNRLASEL